LPSQKEQIGPKIRLDRWLWAARFFKTRSLAKKAIVNGQILVDGARIKPARELACGAVLNIRKESQMWHRGPASLAQTLYEELPESIARRVKYSELSRVERLARSSGVSDGKPTSRQRRQIKKFREQMPTRHDEIKSLAANSASEPENAPK